MLAIRLQRHGRKDLPVYRLVVQESNRHPSSGRIVARVGHHDPRAKTTTIDKEKVSFYLNNGARPSDRAIRLLKAENIALPAWVEPTGAKKQTTKNPDKLRKNQPKEAAAESAADESGAEEAVAEEAPAEAEAAEEKA